ncbi:alpha-L-rhamnosidase C-terminal domain-containing protein [Neobacillus cucumis]|uniref:alpha-L-rhamnosidase C-terminal domain-containing protein n=1 Tax=Neobacillus cucumis TaxID=1740721 RepID=UPI002E1A7F91|nr:alpha-L-rhamnosidase C-terminal domain-containing protein [Neobacillus cucumis]
MVQQPFGNDGILNSVKEGFGDVSMNSFNHYSYGAIGEWMYDEMAGISHDPENPGFKHTILQPIINNDKRITWAKGSFDSVYGTIKSEWEVKNGTLTYDATVPANTTATLYIPTNNVSTVKESGQPIAKAKGVKFIEFKDGKAVYELESGSYEFRSIIAVLSQSRGSNSKKLTDVLICKLFFNEQLGKQ